MQLFSKLKGVGGMLIASAVLLCACQPTKVLETPRADGKSDRYRAAYEIAAAQCDRRAPGLDGQAKAQYESREACIAAKLPTSAAEADLDDCAAYSLRDYNLDECVTEIRRGQGDAGIAGIAACRGRNLCPWDPSDAFY